MTERQISKIDCVAHTEEQDTLAKWRHLSQATADARWHTLSLISATVRKYITPYSLHQIWWFTQTKINYCLHIKGDNHFPKSFRTVIIKNRPQHTTHTTRPSLRTIPQGYYQQHTGTFYKSIIKNILEHTTRGSLRITWTYNKGIIKNTLEQTTRTSTRIHLTISQGHNQENTWTYNKGIIKNTLEQTPRTSSRIHLNIPQGHHQEYTWSYHKGITKNIYRDTTGTLLRTDLSISQWHHQEHTHTTMH